MAMMIGVLREPLPETRVSLTDEGVAALVKKGVEVIVEQGAGLLAFCEDDAYRKAGARIATAQEVMRQSALLLCIHPPAAPLLASLQGKVIVGAYQPFYQKEWTAAMAAQNITCFSLDMLPRTTRAQAMDILSSQANIAGYKAVLLAAITYSRYFPMFMTAAGSIAPAKVLILGAGVAGLQAIATAKRLGAVIEVFDTRPAVKEEVMSLGAKFIEIEGAADASKAGGYAVEQSADYQQRQTERIGLAASKADIIITTAQIPGKKAPLLLTDTIINSLRPGTVIVDLAAATGGNTPFTENNQTVQRNGVTIIGNSSLYSTMPADASKLYGKNIINFLQLILTQEGQLHLHWEDDLVKGCCIAHEGKIVHERLK